MKSNKLLKKRSSDLFISGIRSLFIPIVILFSLAFCFTMAETDFVNPGNILENQKASVNSSKSIVFINDNVEDYQSLLQGIDNAEIHVLNHKKNGIDEITAILKEKQGFLNMHVISHGKPGGFQLGNTYLTSHNIALFKEQLATWKNAFVSDYDLLVYSCRVVSGKNGERFIAMLEDATGLDIAASDDQTGNLELGGDWELEHKKGSISASNLFNKNKFPAHYPHLLTTGGADNYGYTFIDSDETGGTVTFEDISGSGTALAGTDEEEHNVTMPFSFNFYGLTSANLRIGANGAIRFGQTTGNITYSNVNFPIGTALIAPFWDDLYDGTIYYETRGTAPNRRFIIQYDRFEHWSSFSTGTVTLEVILYEGSNNIDFVYDDTVFGDATYDNGNSATIGINRNGSNFLTYSYNTASLAGISSIRFVDPSQNMSYITSNTLQTITTQVPQGATDAQIIEVEVFVTGGASPINATALQLSTNGSTDAANDITNAKVYYTGASATFVTGTQFGSTVSGPNGSFSVTGSQALVTGTNYFWVVYDIEGSATGGNLVDAECATITVNSIARTPVATAPAGSRSVDGPPEYASFPYSTGFETGDFGTEWDISSSNAFGRVQVTTANTPSAGSYHMTMDVNTNNNYATNNADLYINLAGQTNVVLDFNFKDFGDEDFNVDGIYLSDDGGSNFSYVFEIDPGDFVNNVWSYIRLDIDALAASAGLTLNSTFVIRFLQHDNRTIAGNDGFAFDNIEVKRGPVYASFPYSHGFELGYFPEEWVTAGNNGFTRIQTTTANTPNTGQYHMTMDVTTDDNLTTNYADLHVDLSGQTDVILDFYFKDFGDEDNNVDGIYLSDDGGQTFSYVHEIDPDNYTTTYTQIVLDLDALAAGAGLTLNSTFVVRFLQNDNYNIPDDGFAIDDVQLRTTYMASFPYFTGFESGAFGNEWTIGGNGNSRTIVTTQDTPYQGNYHMTMDNGAGVNTLNEAMLRIDLSGQTQVELSFYWKDYADETSAQDAIYFSDDGGASYQLVHSLTPGSTADETWNQIVLDVDVLAAGAGLTLNDQFVISFEQYDNAAINPGSVFSDGLAFDDIALYVPNTLTNWTGNALTTAWETAGNWSNGVPGCSDVAIIPDVSGGSGFFPVISAGFSSANVGSIYIQPNASLTLNVGATLNVCSEWDNKGSAAIGSGTVVFQGTSRQEITGTNNWQNLTINNVGGDILLNDPQNVSGVLTLTDGIIDTQDNTFTMNSGSSTTGASAASFVDGRMTKVGNTDFEFPIGEGTDWAPLAIANLTGDAATEFTAEYLQRNYIVTDQLMTSDPNGDLNRVSILEYWNLTNTGTVSSADVTLYWKSQSFSEIQDFADLQIAHYNGSVWENLGQNAIASVDPGWIRVTGVSSFSPFTFGSTTSDNTLPVDLVSFTAREDNNRVLLDWQTASELNNDFFEVQRSENGENWEVIGKVDGNGTINEVLNYDYTDQRPLFGTSYYRLRQVDFDGQFEYSPVQSVTIEFDGPDLQVSLYPNPTTKDNINLRLVSLNNRNKVKLRLLDMSGKVFLDEFVEIGKFNKDQKIKAHTELHKGIYILEVDQNGIVSKHKVIIL
ncbi:DUF4347 domain-containing protein [Fulvivirgaceae bacterium BMA12]|uniref:DUF4347 domain-containing protein n=1 Tax=Agaribacillus aureus TaxID=3051825 RepID=A0ABT8L8E9_9BACT|nr:DUF4347 domain-containing protein [Fulvivirgaceae bacterium BMA12]